MYSSRIKVGFFDSGIGGLTTLNDCVKYAEQFVRRGMDYTFYYYGDNFHAPYGNLSSEKINAYVDKAFEKFVDLQVDAVVLACNTVTAVCIERLRKNSSGNPLLFSILQGLSRASTVFRKTHTISWRLTLCFVRMYIFRITGIPASSVITLSIKPFCFCSLQNFSGEDINFS